MPSDLSSLVHWILFLPLGAALFIALFLRRAGTLAAWLSTGVAFALAAAPAGRALAAQPLFFRNPGCGCCEVWVTRMAEAGLPVSMEDRGDLAAYAAGLGIPAGLEGCHVGEIDDTALTSLLADLGGHDHADLGRLLRAADADTTRPSVIFAYTIKGWHLPFAGDAANHSALMSSDQIAALAPLLGADADDPWAAFAPSSPEGRWATRRRTELYGDGAIERSSDRGARARRAIALDDVRLEPRIPAKVSTQMAFGDVLTEAARHPVLAERIVTTSADVAVSTNLGGWINKAGVYDRHHRPIFDDSPRLLKWQPNPRGRHMELGISEMNLFMMLSQMGLSAELLGEPLIQIGRAHV